MPRSQPRSLAAFLCALALSTAATAAAPRLGGDSRLPVPRYESIATPEAFGRRGPGKDHRIDWVYHARGLPVRVIEEAESWRKVRDPGGDEVWIHASRLSPNRTVYVKDAEAPGLVLRTAPRPESKPVAYLQRGVVATLNECLGGWRKVTAHGDATGWVPAEALWGGDDCTLPR